MILSRFRRAEPPDPTHVEVRHGPEVFAVALRRSPNARRYTLRVSSATRDIVLTMPKRADLATALQFAERHGGWIAARLARLPESVPFVHGAVIPFRGTPHRIDHRPGARGTVWLDHDGEMPVLAVAGEQAHLARRLTDFLRKEARRDIVAAVSRHAATLGVTIAGITLRDTRSRWGSCSSTGRLNFSWRMILAPPDVLDYLAAHEVAHRREMNHSSRFWRLTRALYPEMDRAEAWLKRHGTGLHRYG
jgi:predicted metal-dependent hydrolase